jgi:hypothetical protein
MEKSNSNTDWIVDKFDLFEDTELNWNNAFIPRMSYIVDSIGFILQSIERDNPILDWIIDKSKSIEYI